MLAKVRVPEVRALRLDRLEVRLAEVWQRRLGVVVAPAGSGKTTLLAGFASHLEVPVAWYRAESWDAQPSAMLRHLHTAVSTALQGSRRPLAVRPWETVEDAAAAIEARPDDRLLLVIDDLHALEGTASEAALERLVAYAPAHLAVIVASRGQPAFNLSRRRVEGTLLEVTSDDLRFRSWEVERLFREVYGLSIPPQELAVLARRTEGWAAGLQLFRLAIEGKSADERRRLLGQDGASSRFIREYLARNVLADLPAELRTFLVETCVLGRLSGTLCDGLLEHAGSPAILEELERRQIFTTQHDDGTYRYHEVLRRHLEAILVESHGEADTRRRYGQAGRVLLAQEEIGDALVAFARAGDWDAVARLVHRRGERLVTDHAPGAWLDALPTALVRNDPWLVLATARRAREEGRWSAAVDAYSVAEAAFGSSEGVAIAKRERAAIVPWVDGRPIARVTDGPGILRAAVARDPHAARSAGVRLGGWWGTLVAGLTALLDGQPADACGELDRVRDQTGIPPAVLDGATLGAAVAHALASGSDGLPEPFISMDGLDATPLSWLGRMARAAAILGPAAGRPDIAELDGLRETCRDAGDPWGDMLIGLMAGWAGLAEDRLADEAVQRLETIAERAGNLDAGVLQAWALALAALTARRAADPRAEELARAAERASRDAACRAPASFLSRAVASADDRAALGGGQVAIPSGRSRSAGAGPSAPAGAHGSAREDETASSVRVGCFGEFRLEVGGRAMALTVIRPRARSVLHLLAVRAGQGVHREVLEAAIWPSDPAGGAAARLQVAISSIRHLLQVDGGASAGIRVDRDRETYRLVLPEGAELDIRAFEDAVVMARAEADHGDRRAAAAAADRAIERYGGPLLVGEGPAEWVLEPRERYHGLAVEAAQLRATIALSEGDPAAAVAACTSGLGIERYHDPFWRLLIEARQMAGDRGAAVRAEAEYHGMLAELGVTPVLTSGSR